jgi:hypothetical protein
MRLNVREFSLGSHAGNPEAFDSVWLASSQVSAPQIFLLNDSFGSSKHSPFMEGIDRLREAIEDENRLEHMVSAAAAFTGFSFSVGYVIWLVRGGILMTSLLSSLPAWRMLDPLPVLSRISDEEDQQQPDEDEARSEREAPMFAAGWAA